MSKIDGFVITNNTINATFASICTQSFDSNNFNDQTLAGNIKTNVTISGNKLNSAWGGSGIDIRGGAGSVDKVLIDSNILQNSAGKPNMITQDAHTTNVTISNNTGV